MVADASRGEVICICIVLPYWLKDCDSVLNLTLEPSYLNQMAWVRHPGNPRLSLGEVTTEPDGVGPAHTGPSPHNNVLSSRLQAPVLIKKVFP